MESYEEAVAEDSELAIAYARWGQLLALRFRTDEALVRTERALALSPDDPDVLAIHAMALDWNGQVDEAVRYAQRAIDIDPDHAAAHSFLAEAYMDSGRYDDALQAALRARELDPEEVWAWRNLGYVYESLGRYEEAVQAYSEGVLVKPLSYLYISLGRNERVLGNYDRALDHFRQASVVDPRNPEGYAELGFTYYRYLQDNNSAINYLEEGIDRDPSFGRNYALLGFVYYAQRNYEAAIEALEKGVSFGYSSQEVFYELGLSYAFLEQCEEGMPWLERALELDPESGPALAGIRLCTES